MRLAQPAGSRASSRASSSAFGHGVAAAEELVPGHDAGDVGAALQEHDRAQAGQAVAEGEEGGEVGLVLHHHHRRLAVPGDVLALLGSGSRVDAGGHSARGDGAQGGQEPLRPVAGEDGHVAAGSHAQGHEAAGRPADLRVRIRPRSSPASAPDAFWA